MEDDADGEKQNRVLLRPWLENMLEGQNIPGLEWFDAEKTMFKVPWKHRSKKDWSTRHSSVFLEWAKNTGRWSEGDSTPNFAQLKTRLRCAFNKAPDIDEMKQHHCSKGEEPYKVYRFNVRKGEKSSFGRKSFQRMTGREVVQRSRSPLVIKYESCEEEIVDENMVYEEIGDYTTLLNSGYRIGNSKKLEEMDPNGIITSQSGQIAHGNQLFTSACNSKGQSSVTEEGKFPVIPLTVELLTSSPNNDSDCDGDSPKKSKQQIMELNDDDDTLQTLDCKSSSCRTIQEEETHGSCSSLTSDSCADKNKMHLLQMASLFVEAADKKKEDVDAAQISSSLQHSGNEALFVPVSNYFIIMPSDCAKEVDNLNEGNVTSGYVTPMDLDVVVDLTKQTKSSELFNISANSSAKVDAALTDSAECMVRTEIDQTQFAGCNFFNKDSKATNKYSSSFLPANETVTVDSVNSGTAATLPEHMTMEQIKSHLEQLIERSKQLADWENQLMSWEIQLQAKEETLYWQDRCFQSELATKLSSSECLSSRSNWQPGDCGTNITTPVQVLVKNRMTDNSCSVSRALATSCVLVSQGTVSGGTAASCELKQKKEQTINRSTYKMFALKESQSSVKEGQEIAPAQNSNSLFVNKQPNLASETGASQPLVDHKSSDCGDSSDVFLNSSQQCFPIVSLVRPNKRLTTIVRFRDSSKPEMPLPQQLLPVAVALPSVEAKVSSDNNFKNYLGIKSNDIVTLEELEIGESVPALSKGNLSLGTVENVGSCDNEAACLREVSQLCFVSTVNQPNGDDGCSLGNILDTEFLTTVLQRSETHNSHKLDEKLNQNHLAKDFDLGLDAAGMKCQRRLDCLQRDKGLLQSDADASNSENHAAECTTALLGCTKPQNLAAKSTISNVSEKTNSAEISFNTNISNPKVVLPVSGQKADTPFSGCESLLDFTKWLQGKTEIISQEECLEKNQLEKNPRNHVHVCSELNRTEISNRSISTIGLQVTGDEHSQNTAITNDNEISISRPILKIDPSSGLLCLSLKVPVVVEEEDAKEDIVDEVDT